MTPGIVYPRWQQVKYIIFLTSEYWNSVNSIYPWYVTETLNPVYLLHKRIIKIKQLAPGIQLKLDFRKNINGESYSNVLIITIVTNSD